MADVYFKTRDCEEAHAVDVNSAVEFDLNPETNTAVNIRLCNRSHRQGVISYYGRSIAAILRRMPAMLMTHMALFKIITRHQGS